MHLKCSRPPHVFPGLPIPDVTPGGPGPPGVRAGVPRKPRDPFIFVPEADGSVGILHRFRSMCWHVGHLMAVPNGRIIYSPTYEEAPDQEYGLWHVQDTVEGAFRDLVQARISSSDGTDLDRLQHLVSSSKRIPSLSEKPAQALRFAARQAVMAAVSNMLRVSPYDEVLRAVRDALAAEVIES